MSLRGHGSLQELLGRVNQYRKRKTQSASADDEQQLVQASVYKPQHSRSSSAKRPRALVQSKLQLPTTERAPKTGVTQPCCPVCHAVLPNKNSGVNAHLGAWVELC